MPKRSRQKKRNGSGSGRTKSGSVVGKSAVNQSAQGNYIAQAVDGGIATIQVNQEVISPLNAREQRYRKILLERVHSFWIKGVFDRSLHGIALLELGMEKQQGAVASPWERVLQIPDQPDQVLPSSQKIVDVFDETGKALLILGGPGSGKTTMLLELARATIARAEQNPTEPIPVVFVLSSWSKQPIDDWLVDELMSKYHIPEHIGRSWIENDNLLLLFDGLDEVKPSWKGKFIIALNDFLKKHLMPTVLCARTQSHNQLRTLPKFQVAVRIQPLSIQQIDTYLAGSGVQLLAVRKSIQIDQELRDLAKSPLMLSIMTIAYKDIPIEDLKPLNSIDSRRNHIFDFYIRMMFRRKKISKDYSFEKSILSLSWLARNMIQRNQTMFMVEQIQPSWLQTDNQMNLYVAVIVLLCGCISLITGLLIGWLFFDVRVGLIMGVFLGLAHILSTVGKFKKEADEIKNDDIYMATILRWSWRNVNNDQYTKLVGGLKDGLALSLTTFSIASISGYMLVGTIVAIINILVMGLITVGTIKDDFVSQGIIKSLINALIVGLVIGGPTALLLGWVMSPSWLGVIIGVSYGLSRGFIYGGLAVIRHFALRFVFYRNGYIPWNVGHFLDTAADCIFLYKVGDGYIFMHNLLLQYFGSLKTEE